MGGSASYRYGKKISAAMAAGASNEEIEELKRQRQEAIDREKARKAERLASQVIEEKSSNIKNGTQSEIDPITGKPLSEASRLIRETSAQEFHNKLVKAKASQNPKKAWRVDSTHEVSAYEKDGDDLYVTAGGSTIAVKKNGDIISVCKNKSDITVRGSEILARAVALGGTKLDSYSKNHEFYTANGFEPVSWCKWNNKFKPPDWNPKRDEREPIIFYRYVGHPVTETAAEFMARVPASRGINPKTGRYNKDFDYDAAYDARDKQM